MKSPKQHYLYVLQNRAGGMWTYTNGKLVVYSFRKSALATAKSLDKKPGWRVKRAEVIVTEVRT